MNKQQEINLSHDETTLEMLRWFSRRIKNQATSFDLLASIKSAAKLPKDNPLFKFFFSPDMKKIWQDVGGKGGEKLRAFAFGFLLAGLTSATTACPPTRGENQNRNIINKLLKRITRDIALKAALADSVHEIVERRKFLPPLPKGMDKKFHKWKLKLKNGDAVDLLRCWYRIFLKDVTFKTKRQKTNGGAIQDAIQGMTDDAQFQWALKEALDQFYFFHQTEGELLQNPQYMDELLKSWARIYAAKFKDIPDKELATRHLSRIRKSKKGQKGFYERCLADMVELAYGPDNAAKTAYIYNAVFDDIELHGESTPFSVVKARKALKKVIAL